MKNNKIHDENSLVFKDFIKAPIFGVTAHQNEVECDGWVWKTGVVTPLAQKNGVTEPVIPGLNVDHAEIMLALMTFQPANYHFSPNPSGEFKFSLKKLCEVAYGSYSKQYYTKACKVLDDLSKCWGSVFFKDTQETHYFRVLKDILIISKPSRRNTDGQELWLDNVVLHESYQALLGNLHRQLMIDVRVFRQVTSGPLVKAIYMYIPSRAVHHTKDAPFKIKLQTLFDQLGHKQNKFKYKSKRYEIMTRGVKPIIDQLNGVAVYNGTMYCTLKESADGSDWMLCAWSKIKNQKPISNLTEKWFKTELNFTDKQWASLIQESNQLDWDQWQIDLICHFAKEPHEKWLINIYAIALSESMVIDTLAAESDGEAGLGAITKKYRTMLKAKRIAHAR